MRIPDGLWESGMVQKNITEEWMVEMLGGSPRRERCSPEYFNVSQDPAKDHLLNLPFCETFGNAFEVMVRGCVHSGVRPTKKEGKKTGYVYIQGDDGPRIVREWLANVGRFVGIRDCLAVSFALDHDRVDGQPGKPLSEIGELRSRAKDYRERPTRENLRAADLLAEKCLDFLRDMTCYDCIQAVTAVPPSRPGRAFNLPGYLAKRIAQARDIEDLTGAVRTLRQRPQIKDLRFGEKLPALRGTIAVDMASVRDKHILIIDDLYQSGISMNYVAMLLQQAGARLLLGLACDKTLRNDANVAE